MDTGMLLAVVLVPVVFGLLAAFLVTKVQNLLARRRERSETGVNEDSSL